MILAVLFVVRLTMAFQFQSVAAIAPLLGTQFSVSLADIGVLIGLYLTPGIALALPGGAIGQRFGDKRTVLGALMLMLIGNLAMALSDSWTGQIAGRLVAGAGGVLLNVQMTKMVADWFAGREIATAMAIFVNSWPAGIALSLLTLPLIGTAYGVSAVYFAMSALIGFGLVLLAATYKSPSNSKIAAATSARLDRNAAIAVVAAGLIWGLYNVGFAMIFSFAELILVVGCIAFAMLMVALPRSGAVILTVAALGLVCGQPAGPILSLPTRVLQPTTRAIGMGVFYTVYYATMMLGPAVGGACAKWAGSAAAAFDFGAAMVLACPVILWAFNRIPAAAPKAA